LFIVADKSRITQVISNVLDNAIKFSKPNVNHENGVGIIIINTEKVDDQTIVTITDAGTGIEPEILPRLKVLSGNRIGLIHLQKYCTSPWW
jgi:signal transduction histidine kinase